MSSSSSRDAQPVLQQLFEHAEDTAIRMWQAAIDWSAQHTLAFVLAIIALYAAVAIVHPLDFAQLIDADSLYPVQMTHFGLLDFRPPPPNRIFPDVAAHWAVGHWVNDPLVAKVIVGGALFATTLLALALLKPPFVVLAIAAMMAWPGFQALNSATHYTLPLLVLLVQLCARRPALDVVAFGLAAFINILAVLPLALLAFDGKQPGRLLARLTAMGAGVVFAALYSDFGATFLELAIVLPLWLAVLLLASRLNVMTALVVALTALLALSTVLGLFPPRYTIPVAASIIVALTPIAVPTFDWRRIALPFVLLPIMLSTGNADTAREMQRDFSCVANALGDRGIEAIATDHWTAKPLYFALRAERGQPSSGPLITQMNFADSSGHPWMAPYSFAGQPTRWALRSSYSCDGPAHGQPRYCAQSQVATVVSETPLCERFTLYEYDEMVPRHYQPPPPSKVEAIAQQFQHYVGEAAARLRATPAESER